VLARVVDSPILTGDGRMGDSPSWLPWGQALESDELLGGVDGRVIFVMGGHLT